MIFVLGMVAGAAIALVGFVAFMAPKHWDWYHQNKDLQKSLVKALAERDHLKNLTSPIEWGTAAQHEARIVTKDTPPWEGYEEPAGGVLEHRFDDILDGAK